DEWTQAAVNATPSSAATTNKPLKVCVVGLRASISAFLAEAGVLRLTVGLRLRLVLFGTHPSNDLVRAGAQVDVHVINITHDVRFGAEARHAPPLRRAHVFAPARHDAEEVAVVQPLKRILQRRRISRPFAVRTVANVAFRVIAAIARIGVPVDSAIRLHIVGWASILVEGLAVLGLDRCRICGPISQSNCAREHWQDKSDHEKTIAQRHLLRGAAAVSVAAHFSIRLTFLRSSSSPDLISERSNE